MNTFRKLNTGELERADLEAYKKKDKLPFSLLADNIRSAGNIGSLFRTADAFLCKHFFLTGISATPPNREITKTALGATESVDWSYHAEAPGIIKELKAAGMRIAAIEQTQNSTPLGRFEPAAGEEYLFILGNEVDGVGQELLNLCDLVLEIPQGGTKHSINVAIAGGICMWHFYEKKT